jgi:hypothetical protein
MAKSNNKLWLVIFIFICATILICAMFEQWLLSLIFVILLALTDPAFNLFCYLKNILRGKKE